MSYLRSAQPLIADTLADLPSAAVVLAHAGLGDAIIFVDEDGSARRWDAISQAWTRRGGPVVGTTLPERKERFPVVTVTRKMVDGHMFPSEAGGEGVLVFPNISISVRWSVKISDYYRFGSRVNIKEIDGR